MHLLLAASFGAAVAQILWCSFGFGAAIESAKPCLVGCSCCWQQAVFVRVWQPLSVLLMVLNGARKVAVAAGSSLLRSICVATLVLIFRALDSVRKVSGRCCWPQPSV